MAILPPHPNPAPMHHRHTRHFFDHTTRKETPMFTLSPTQWLALSIILALLAAMTVYYLVFWDKTGAPACRTADMSTIQRQTDQLQDRVPAALPNKRARAGAPVSYDVERTPDRRVADISVFRANIKQVEVTAAQHALIDMGRGVRRATPYSMGHTAFAPYKIAYELAWMGREHQNTDAEVTRA